MDIMQVPGGPSADLYVDRCTSLLYRSVVWSHSLGYSAITNGTIAQDSLWPGGEVCMVTATLKCGIYFAVNATFQGSCYGAGDIP